MNDSTLNLGDEIFAVFDGRRTKSSDREFSMDPGRTSSFRSSGVSESPGIDASINELLEKGFILDDVEWMGDRTEIRIHRHDNFFSVIFSEDTPARPPVVHTVCDGVEILETIEWQPGLSLPDVLEDLAQSSMSETTAVSSATVGTAEYVGVGKMATDEVEDQAAGSVGVPEPVSLPAPGSDPAWPDVPVTIPPETKHMDEAGQDGVFRRFLKLLRRKRAGGHT